MKEETQGWREICQRRNGGVLGDVKFGQFSYRIKCPTRKKHYLLLLLVGLRLCVCVCVRECERCERGGEDMPRGLQINRK